MMQKDYFGYCSIKNLKQIINNYSFRNIFLVTGEKSYSLCGAEKILSELLLGYSVFRFSNFAENPKLGDVEKGIGYLKECSYDGIIAVGGGSVIDIAKLTNIFAAQEELILDYLKGRATIKNRGRPLIAIPTTAGTGSEATQFAVLYVDKVKYSIDHKYLLPNIAIIDPQFTLSMPPYLTATTGMDALCQAIESYWCINSTEKSKEYAKEAIDLILKNISEAVNKPSKHSRSEMSKAAHLAGKAINITRTTAPHAISYPITSYFNVSHGHAVSLTLGSMLVYNSEVNKDDVVDKRGLNYIKTTSNELNRLLECSNVYESQKKINKLMQEIGLYTRLSDAGMKKEEDIQIILDNVDIERLNNNPRAITKKSLREILFNLL